MTSDFDIIGYREGLSLTQAQLGTICGQGWRSVAAWEQHQRSRGKVSYGPPAATVLYLMLVRRILRAYYRSKSPLLLSLLPKVFRDRIMKGQR